MHRVKMLQDEFQKLKTGMQYIQSLLKATKGCNVQLFLKSNHILFDSEINSEAPCLI